ncbi:MAG: hypothetical protein Q4C01_05135 [Clostridia bacterium]|nr:hypothetical protein [Clostridia bacterium]
MAEIIAFLKANYIWIASGGVILLGVLCSVLVKKWEIAVFASLYAGCEGAYQLMEGGTGLSITLYYLSLALLFAYVMVISIMSDAWYTRIIAALSVILRVFRIYFYYSIIPRDIYTFNYSLARPYVLTNYVLIFSQFFLAALLIIMYFIDCKVRLLAEERFDKELYHAAIREKRIAPPHKDEDKFSEHIPEETEFDVSIDKTHE